MFRFSWASPAPGKILRKSLLLRIPSVLALLFLRLLLLLLLLLFLLLLLLLLLILLLLLRLPLLFFLRLLLLLLLLPSASASASAASAPSLPPFQERRNKIKMGRRVPAIALTISHKNILF